MGGPFFDEKSQNCVYNNVSAHLFWDGIKIGDIYGFKKAF